jgi:hypothetical protein
MPTLNKWDILSHPAIDWKPHVGQLVVAENPCRHKVLAAGRRFGKSYMGGADKLLPEVFFTRPIANQLLSEYPLNLLMIWAFPTLISRARILP